MRILQINSVCGLGSTGRITVDLFHMLLQSGHSCMIAYGRGNAPDDINSLRIGTDFDVNLHGIYTRITDRHGFASKNATLKLLETVEKYAPDLIHLHNIHGYYINIETLFKWLKSYNRPVIWTLHDCWPYTGHCAHYSVAACSRWQTGCFNCPQKRTYPASFFVDSSKKNYSDKKRIFTSLQKLTLVTPSNWLKSEIKQSFLSKFQIRAIPNGVDLNAFRPTTSTFKQQYGIKNKIMVLGVASAWSSRKGLLDFIKLSLELDDSFCIVLVGLNAKQLKTLPRNILGIEKTNNLKDLAEIYSAADVFVNPSKEETMGLVTVEALACGTPAIVYPFTAVPETLDCGSGLIVNGYDEMVKAIKLNVFRHFRSGHCVLRADCFERDKQYQLYKELYEEVLK